MPFSAQCCYGRRLLTMASKKEDADLVLHSAGWDYVHIPKPEDTFFAITGHESQVLTVKLQSGDMVRGEPGTMLYLTDGMQQTGRMLAS